MKIHEILTESTIPNVWYHGSDTKITQFSIDKTGLNTNINFGPGVYITSDKTDARQYGKYIHTIKTKITKSKLIPTKRKFDKSLVSWMINHPLSEFHTEDLYTNWDENKRKALQSAVDTAYQAHAPNDYKGLIHTIWYDFYRTSLESFFKNIIPEWNGDLLERSVGYHYICFKPELLHIVDIEEN